MISSILRSRLAAVTAAAILLVPASVGGQTRSSAAAPSAQDPSTQPRTARVVAGPQYAAGALHKLILGNAYRDLWTLPIEVEVLDLEREGGGLEAAFRVGRLQTKGLAMRGADGRSYTFRSVDKDLTRALPEELRDTPIADIARDQVAASFPGGSVLAVALARAAGVLETQPRLVLMPDDPRLGEFREEFAGLLGTFFEFPSVPDGGEGTFGAAELVDGREMFERIRTHPGVRIDAEAFLRARLVDLYLGDWDRHVGQWRWARLPGNDRWQPISEDRDQAFSRYEGLAMAAARDREPKFDRFGEDYQGLEGLTWNARALDRWLLSGLSWSDWERAAARVQAALDDATIDAALRQLHPGYFELAAADLRRGLRARRDGLRDVAWRFYRYLSGHVDLRLTDASDTVEIDRQPDGTTVRVTQIGPGSDACAPVRAADPWLERRFLPDETNQLRIYTGDGDDRILVRGGDDSIAIKIVGGGGTNALCETNAGGSRSFDASSAGRRGPGDRVASNLWIAPSESIQETGDPSDEQGPAKNARRDWGSTSYRIPWFGFGPDLGAFVGFGVVYETFDFRKRPYATQHQLRGGFAFGAGRPRFDYSGIYHLENRRQYLTVQAVASGIETLNWFGVGNDAERDEDDDFHRVEQRALILDTRLVLPASDALQLSAGASVQYRSTELEDERFIVADRPFGIADTGQVGLVAGMSFNNRSGGGVRDIKGSDDVLRWGASPVGRGFTLDADVHHYIGAWGLDESYTTVAGNFTAATWFPNQGIGVAVRGGGQKNWGAYPYYDAAFIGARHVRGLPRNRFAGDASAFGNLTVLTRVGALTLVIPGRWGVFGRVDAGRVWLQGEDSDTWHWGYGGGVWWAPYDLSSALRLHVADADEGVAVYLLFGFGF